MNAPSTARPLPALRPEAEGAPSSGIVDVANAGRERPGLIPLWVGEGDLPTPAFICEAATRSLAEGETFYTYQRGIPELREALARYHTRLYGQPSDPERFFVTIGGMHAAQIAIRMVAGNGDEALIPTPAWPNFAGALEVAGARTVGVPLTLDERGWSLDLERLASAVGPRTKVIVINSPANPTGWTASLADLRGILDIARRHGLWIIADEIYGQFVYDPETGPGGRAPSFRDVAEGDDRILYIQTFSKNWSMTGWRLGWLEASPAFGQIIENLVQYSTSGVPVPSQRAGIAALEHGESFLAEQIGRAAAGRTIVRRLVETGLVDLPAPAGAFYAFPKVKGVSDSKELAIQLVHQAGVGVAPGSAFGPAGEGALRLCFARKASDLEEAVRRIADVLPRIVG
jgi:aspartate/methionine/tyrosine aminotransferase